MCSHPTFALHIMFTTQNSFIDLIINAISIYDPASIPIYPLPHQTSPPPICTFPSHLSNRLNSPGSTHPLPCHSPPPRIRDHIAHERTRSKMVRSLTALSCPAPSCTAMFNPGPGVWNILTTTPLHCDFFSDHIASHRILTKLHKLREQASLARDKVCLILESV